MNKYSYRITEVLDRIVFVEANSAEEGKDIVEEMYKNEEIVLDADDFSYVKIEEEVSLPS